MSPSGGSFLLNPMLRQRLHIRASAGGDLFGIWHTETSSKGFHTLLADEATLRGIFISTHVDHVAPGPDGRTVYTGRGGVLNADGKPVRGASETLFVGSSELTIPSPDAAYFLGVDGLNGLRPANRPNGRWPVTASIYAAGDGDRLLTLPEFEEMAITGHNESWIPHDLTVEKRFHFVPAANLLITIPFTDDRLVLRRLDIAKALAEVGADYFVITSPPILFAEAGKAIKHQIEGRSKAGGLRYSLIQGPDGLSVTPTGKLTWQPPKGSSASESAIAKLTVTDLAGKEHFHTIKIRVN